MMQQVAADTEQAAMSDPAKKEWVERGRTIIRAELRGVEQLIGSIDGSLGQAVELLTGLTGRLVVTGVGKSGLIGAKLAATFASTGTPSFFVHAAEAAHGDLGMIVRDDVVLAISNSGNSRELYPVLDYCAANSIPLIAMCGRPESRLGKAASVLLPLPEVREVCPNNLAPTTSSTVTLVLGHAIAVLLMEARSFKDSDFAAFHPGGRLGLLQASLRRYIDEFGDEVPAVHPDDPVEKVIGCLAQGRKGCVVVEEPGSRALRGLITEGDLRRAYAPDIFKKTARDIMTSTPKTMTPEHLVREALAEMKRTRISNILVVEEGRVIYVVHIKDLMQRGYA